MSTACASCRHQRKKCEPDCIMARHFPQGRKNEFEDVQRVWGVNSVSKRLKDLDFPQQQEAVQSMEWEASCWKQDPIGGPLGEHRRVINRYMNENIVLRNENIFLKEQLSSTQQLLMQPSCSALVGRLPVPNGNEDYARLNGNHFHNYSNLPGRYRDSQEIIDVHHVAPYHASAQDRVSQERDYNFHGFQAPFVQGQGRESNGGGGIQTSTLQEQEIRESKGGNGILVSYQEQEIIESNNGGNGIIVSHQEQGR